MNKEEKLQLAKLVNSLLQEQGKKGLVVTSPGSCQSLPAVIAPPLYDRPDTVHYHSPL